MIRAARGTGAALLLLVLAVGLPVALWALTGWSAAGAIGGQGSDPAQLARTLASPDDGSLVLVALTLVGWLGWATFALALVIEVVARLRGVPTWSIPGLGVQQRVVGALVATALLGVVPVTAATAATPAAPMASVAAGAVTVPVELPLKSATNTPDRATSPAGSTVTVTSPGVVVAEGDTLWRLAETHLGSGLLWQELATANYERPQPDGAHLTGSHVLQPGWTLLLPQTPQAPVEDGQHVVVAGDTLSSIARHALGDADRYPELVTATVPITQPDGRHLQDPDIILPGWTVAIPTVSNDPAALGSPPGEPAATPAAPTDPAPIEQDPEAAPPPTVAATGDPAEGAAAAEAAGLDAADDGAVAPLRTAAGIGALLAAGFVAALALRRGRQRAKRRPGHRIVLPSRPATRVAEAQLREVAAVARPGVVTTVLADLAMACRVEGLGLPRLRAARLELCVLELYLVAPAVLPPPWTAVGEESTIWTRQLPEQPADHVAADPLSGDAAAVPQASPYPTLVTLGQDTDRSLLLVNLDELGVLGITATGRSAVETQAAIAAELATSPWSEDALVTVTGADPALCAALPGGRIRTADPQRLLVELQARIARAEPDLARAGSERIADARQADALPGDSGEDSDLEYEVVMVMAPLPPAIERELISVAGPRHGISVVLSRETGRTADPGQAPLEERAMWILEHRTPENGEPTAMLHPVAVPLVPQTLGVDALHALLDAVSHSGRGTIAASEGHAGASGVTGAGAEATTDAQTANQMRTIDLADPTVPPVLRLLGPVTVEGATGPEPGTHTARTVALLAVLAAHRQGRTRDQLAAALSPNHRLADATLHALISRARRWLGTAADGRSYLVRTVAAGSAVYRLDPEVGTDWDVWQQLVGHEPAQAPVVTLTAALDLVRDAPLAGVIERHYTWAEPLREEMVASIVDVAHAVAGQALQRRDFPLARGSVQAGRRADPSSEVLWRDALRIESAAGAHGTVASLVHHIQRWSDDSGLDLDPATEALVLQLGSARMPEREPTSGGRT